MSESGPTRKALVCRSVRDAQRGGDLEDVEVAALQEAFEQLKRFDASGASKVEDPANPGQPNCLTTMPSSLRLLSVSHRGMAVGVVVPTYRGGGRAQRDGIISQASGNPDDRTNLASFFFGGTAERD